MKQGSIGAALAVLLALAVSAAAVSNAVTEWQAATAQVVREFNLSTQISAKYYALTNIAQYQALLANKAGGGNIDNTAVTAFAAHYVLSYYFPFRQYTFDALIAKQVANVSAQQKAAARSLAQPFAIKLIVSRVNDSTQQWAAFKPAPADGPPGAYRFTPGQTFVLYPQLANATTFATPTATPAPAQQFGATFTPTSTLTVGPAEEFFASKLTAYKPLQLGSAEYLDELNTTYALGSVNSTYRRPYDTDTARFWAALDGTSAVGGQFYTIAQSLLPNDTSLLATAELFARLGAAQFDANVLGWYLKFYYLFWRPVNAIRAGAGNITADATWLPLLKTPAHPEYPSTHAATAGASAQTMARYFGSDNTTFTATSEYAPIKLAPRTYSSFSQAALEVGWSRVYGGIHFPKSGPDGQQVGQLVANTVNDNFPASMDAIFGTSFAASSSGSSRGGGGSPVPPASIGRHL